MIKRSNSKSIILYLETQTALVRNGLAILTVIATTMTTIYYPVIGDRAAFLLFAFGITQVSFWLGPNPGFFSVILSLIAVNTLILLPTETDAHDILALNAGFCFVSFVLVVTTSYHRGLTQALRESQQDLAHAQEVGHIGNWRMKVPSNELTWSDENYNIFGIAKGTPMTYEAFLATVHPDDREYVDRMWRASLQGDPYDIEHRLLVAGKVKWVRESALLEFSKKGDLLGAFGITQDITERKRSEQALVESQQCYALVFQSAMDAIITIDADQRVSLFNAAAEKMFGCTVDEAIGVPIEHFIPKWSSSDNMYTRPFSETGSISCCLRELPANKGLRINGDEFPIEASISESVVNGKKSFTFILRDVSERIRAEIALKEQLRLQDQLVKVAATVPGLICSFRLRLDGSITMPYASPSIESIFGFRHDDIGEEFSPIFARIHLDDIGHMNDTIAESARTQHPWLNSFRYNHPIKGELWLEGNFLPLCEVNGGFLWHGYIQDVTERTHAEKELQERTARYELVLDGAQDGIWDWDVPNKKIIFSSRWEAMLGYNEHELSNTEEEWIDSIHPDDKAHVLTAVQMHFEGKSPVFCEEYRMRCKDGSWKWILDRGLAQKNNSGEVIRMAGSGSDITERKLAEATLRERENELRLIMDATPALISYMDTDFKYLRVNATYEDWFGMTADHILGKHAQEVIGTEAWKIAQPYLERVIKGEQVSFDQCMPYEHGCPRWVHATYIPNKDVTGAVKSIVVHVVDIEERKQTEQKIALLNQNLQRRIEELQVIFNTVPIGLSIINDANDCHIKGNPVFEEMLGLAPGKALFKRGEPPTGFTIMKDGRKLTNEELPMLRAAQGELITNQIIDIHRPDGVALTMLINASPLFNEEGMPRGAVGTYLDITALKQAKESVEKIQLRLQLFVEQAPLSIAMFDREMNYLVTSRRWIEEFGGEFENLKGCNHYTLHGDLSAEWKQIHAKALAGEFLKNDEDLWIRADGSQHWLRWSVYPWKNLVDEIGGIIISCEDITARRQAEQALRDSEARLALVFEQVKAGYWDWDLSTHKLYLSPELKQQIDYDDSALLDVREELKSRVHPDDQGYVFAIAENLIAGKQKKYETEFRLRHKDGSYCWIHSRGVLLTDHNNNAHRILGINLDISDYKKQKEISKRRDKMETAFRLSVAVQTAAAIAHELNQPLAAISSYADVALHLLQTGTPNQSKLSQLMENCSMQAQRAGDVIRQLMVLLHKGETASEIMDINTSIHEAIDIMKADGIMNGSKIELYLTPGLPQIKADALQIQKILITLLRNGLESMHEQGETTDPIIVITHQDEVNPSMIKVTVRDSGQGVTDAAMLKKIFQPFHSTKPTGLGMGLPISRSLIAAHGGKMWAEQNIGNGISIHFTLPWVI